MNYLILTSIPTQEKNSLHKALSLFARNICNQTTDNPAELKEHIRAVVKALNEEHPRCKPARVNCHLDMDKVYSKKIVHIHAGDFSVSLILEPIKDKLPI